MAELRYGEVFHMCTGILWPVSSSNFGCSPIHSTSPETMSYTAPCTCTSMFTTLFLTISLCLMMRSMAVCTFSFVASATCSASEAWGISLTAACAASIKSARSSPILPGLSSNAAPDRTALTASVTAPHWVLPVTTTSFVFSMEIANSVEPNKAPLPFEMIFPAVRSTKRSPGRLSNISSTGARESAPPKITAMGCCPPSPSCTST
mmetsp:Transcript_8529/g.15236  ORF Transcript_8529/g.15236 Transcript_8529/m.15236 type:complete len:206 (-) Transcript_8529:1061-1678(-)